MSTEDPCPKCGQVHPTGHSTCATDGLSPFEQPTAPPSNGEDIGDVPTLPPRSVPPTEVPQNKKSTCDAGNITDEVGDAETIAPSNAKPHTDNPASCFGDYELLEEIARGGMGVVYKAKHRQLQRLTALKMILSGRFSSAGDIQRFKLEAESAARLDHPGIVPIYEIGESEGQAFFAMKLVEGGTLAGHMQHLLENTRDGVELMIRVARAVHHAHQRGILHRDLKPANILLDEDGNPSVTDFGLAKSTSGDSDLTATGAVLGTPSYMPPEQAAGQAVTTSADIYSLGAIFYEVLTGKPPVQGQSNLDVLLKALDSAIEAPRKIRSDVDRDLELICLKCLRKDPEERYATALEFAQDLEAWRDGDPLKVKPLTFSQSVGRWLKQNQKLVYATFALVTGILVCAVPAISILSEGLGDVYDKFPSESPPLVFWVTSLPSAVSVAATALLFLVLWPLIGYANDWITEPSTLWRASLRGISTAAVLGLVFYVLIGWLIVTQGTRNISHPQIERLAQAVWPPDERTVEEARTRAEQMYPDLASIPSEQRALVVKERMVADLFAVGPTSLGMGLFGLVFFSTPVVYGTMISYSLRRHKQYARWISFIRYLLLWWGFTYAPVVLISLLIAFGSAHLPWLEGLWPLPAGGLTTMLLIATFLWSNDRRAQRAQRGLFYSER